MTKIACQYGLFILLSLLIVGCQSTDKKFYPYELNVEGFQEVAKHKKILLIPTQLFSITEKMEGNLYNDIDLSIKSYLESKGYKVAISTQISSIWAKHKQQTNGFYDQDTGQINKGLLENTIENAILELKNLNEFSAIIIPKVVLQHVHLTKKSLNKGSWDGVTRKVISSYGTENGWTRHTAMSLAIKVVSNKLKLIFNSRGGMDFLSKSMREKNTYSQSLKKSNEIAKDDIAEAIEIAFYPFINSATIEATLPDSYSKIVARKMYSFLKYPESAREKKLEGQAIVGFKVSPSGAVKDIEIVRSSKHAVLDAQAVNIIKSADPFPPPPTPFFKGDVVFQFPIVFKQ